MTDGFSSSVAGIGDVIRLAVAPVFLLSGVGVMLTVLTNRLARAVDRARAHEARVQGASPAEQPEVHQALSVLARRARLLSYAIAQCTVCALLVSLVVVTLFVGAFLKSDISGTIAALFIIAMLSFIGAMLCFLREVFVATQALRIGVRPEPQISPKTHR
jgi:membrane glycosyltransferase